MTGAGFRGLLAGAGLIGALILGAWLDGGTVTGPTSTLATPPPSPVVDEVGPVRLISEEVNR